MAGLVPLPTHRVHSTSRLTHREAHTLLSDFLERADVDAAYRPDSTVTERGPQAVSTGANPNLTLHHLKRILTGIEGKRVGGLIMTQEEEPQKQPKQNVGPDTTEDWQDKESFILEQGEADDEVDLNAEDRHPGADLDQPADSADEQELLKVETDRNQSKRNQPAGGHDDKAERKRLKKMRNKEDKAVRAKVRTEKKTKA